jgi:hypothetical protein
MFEKALPSSEKIVDRNFLSSLRLGNPIEVALK